MCFKDLIRAIGKLLHFTHVDPYIGLTIIAFGSGDYLK